MNMEGLVPETTDLSSWLLDFSAAKSLTMCTGNVVRRSNSTRRHPVTPEQEILDCIKAALGEWVSKINRDQVELKALAEHAVCSLMQDNERIGAKEREDIKLSAKLFIYRFEPGMIKESASRACLELGVTQLDSVILALPPLSGGECRSLEELQPPWEEMEALVQEKKVSSIGVSDLDHQLLEALCLKAQVQPSSCQVNLASCCVIPPDLTTFASENNIQLLTHNDPTDILPLGPFQDALGASVRGPGTAQWAPRWILRYSAIIKNRGIIKSKGYVVKAERAAGHY